MLLFEDLAPELRISGRPKRRAGVSRASFTRVRAPGCYAFQVDGLGFSYTIVFEARIAT